MSRITKIFDCFFALFTALLDHIAKLRHHGLSQRRTVVVTGAKSLLGKAVFKTLRESEDWGEVIGTYSPR